MTIKNFKRTLDVDFLRDRVGDTLIVDLISALNLASEKGFKQDDCRLYNRLLKEVCGATDPFLKYAEHGIVDGSVYHSAVKFLIAETNRLMGDNPFCGSTDDIKNCLEDIHTMRIKAFENTLYVKDLLRSLKSRFSPWNVEFYHESYRGIRIEHGDTTIDVYYVDDDGVTERWNCDLTDAHSSGTKEHRIDCLHRQVAQGILSSQLLSCLLSGSLLSGQELDFERY